MAAMTCCRVASMTPALPLDTRDTVCAETPAVAVDYYAALVSVGDGGTAVLDAAMSNRALICMAIASLIVLLPAGRAGGAWVAEASGRVPSLARFATEGRYSQVFLALEGFKKKTQKTPPEVIRLAERRLASWRERGRD